MAGTSITRFVPMQVNVSQQLLGPVGSVRNLDIEVELNSSRDARPSSVKGHVTLMRTDKGILAQGTAEAEIHGSCVRCLTTFVGRVELTIEEEFIAIAAVAKEQSVESLEAEGLLIDSQHTLDLGPALREYVALSTPIKPLCRPNCAGLCSICGINLNEESCACALSGEPLPHTGLSELRSLTAK